MIQAHKFVVRKVTETTNQRRKGGETRNKDMTSRAETTRATEVYYGYAWGDLNNIGTQENALGALQEFDAVWQDNPVEYLGLSEVEAEAGFMYGISRVVNVIYERQEEPEAGLG